MNSPERAYIEGKESATSAEENPYHLGSDEHAMIERGKEDASLGD